MEVEPPSSGSDIPFCEHCGEDFAKGDGMEGFEKLCDCPEEEDEAEGEGKTFVFDPQSARKELAKMIVMHEYPLSMVEQRAFRQLCSNLQPLWMHVSRDAIRDDILKMYKVEKTKTMELLEKNPSRFAVTTEMWTCSDEKKHCMTVAAHFIDDSWNLQRRILRFVTVMGSDEVETLPDALLKCLSDWKINSKLSTLTIEDCTKDKAVTQIVSEKLWSSPLMMGGTLLHMGCCAQILNLIVKNVLEVIDDGLDKIRESVNYWTETPERVEMFEITACELKIKSTEKLALDSDNKWDSTYLMLKTVLRYKSAFPQLEQRDSLYKSMCLLLEEDEWLLVEEICDKLRLFYHVMKMFVGTAFPTVNLLFLQVYQIRSSIHQWLSSTTREEVKKMASNMMEKFEKYWNQIHGIMVVATILDPRFKMKFIECFFPEIYGDGFSVEIERVRRMCYDLMKEYKTGSRLSRESRYGDDSSKASSQSNMTPPRENANLLAKFHSFVHASGSDPVKLELDYYLEENVLPWKLDSDVSNFDILDWWKTNGNKYPILRDIARDILAIPAFAVTSKFAFSTSGGVLSFHRNRLLPKTLEALICTRDWLLGEMKDSSPGTLTRFRTLDEGDSDDDDIWVF